MKHVARAALAIALAPNRAGWYAISDAKRADASTVLGPGLVTVTVSIHYSHFSMAILKVRRRFDGGVPGAEHDPMARVHRRRTRRCTGCTNTAPTRASAVPVRCR